ncbi:MAG: hypothetical protein R3E89_16390 [Thiolinea sp.]
MVSILSATTVQVLPITGWGQSWKQAVMPVLVLAADCLYCPHHPGQHDRSALHSPISRTSHLCQRHAGHIILLRHALRGAPAAGGFHLGSGGGGRITGSVVVEKIFRIPGLGTTSSTVH